MFHSNIYGQNDRIEQIKLKLESIVVDSPGLNEKAELNVSNLVLTDFLRALTSAHKVNLNINPELNKIVISNNFSNASVADILVFLCQEYELDIDFSGNILSIKKFENIIPYTHKIIPVNFDKNNDLISVDLKRDTLYRAFKKITEVTGHNLIPSPGLENVLLTSFIKEMPFENAMDKIAYANNLIVTSTEEGNYLFESDSETKVRNRNFSKNQKQPQRNRVSNFYFKVIDTVKNEVNVDLENIPIASIVHDLGNEFKLNMFTLTPLKDAGSTTVKAQKISVDDLFDRILENTDFTVKKENSIYYFGKRDQVSLRNTVTIPLLYRSIEVLTGKSSGTNRMPGVNRNSNSNYYGGYGQNNSFGGSNYGGYGNNNFGNNNLNRSQNRQQLTTNTSSFQNHNSKAEALISMLPAEVKANLDIQTDIELNSFIVSGPDQDIEHFKKFVKYIDKPVPNVNIEVMFIEINKSATVETGITWGVGEQPVKTQGQLGPTTDFTIGASSINKMINGGSLGATNLGAVVPEFFVNIKAMETNGDIKVRSTPKLSALNGHTASFTAGETTYYAVTERNIYGSQNPQTSEITNYYPLEAQTAINIKPVVSADGNISMEINVVQSSFNGKKVDEDAPPGINAREFTSVVRVKDQNLIVLGGLEEVIKNDSGTGIPLLARIPVIKWLFSSRKREDSKKKLVVFIKPTIIY